ncbi:acyl-CoA synthetase [bacterium]|nr:acyl-CoA synthetase [bacterium]
MNPSGTKQEWGDFLYDVNRYSTLIKQTKQIYWAIACNDSYWFAVCLFAVLNSNCKPVLLPNNQEGTLNQHSSDYDSIIGDQNNNFNINVSTEKLTRTAEYDFKPVNLSLEIIIFTSGSTGKPKKVVKRLQQVEAEIQQLEELWGDRLNNSIILSSVSHQHIYGLIFRLLWPLAAGRLFYSADIAFPEELKFIADANYLYTFITSPSFLKRINSEEYISNTMNNIAVTFSSGSELPSDTAHKCEKIFSSQVIEVLGSTETGGIAWRQQNSLSKIYWRSFPCVKIALAAQNRLSITSPYLETAEPYILEDSANIIDENLFELCGRLDRIVKIEGKRASLPALEAQLNENSFIESSIMMDMESHNRQSVVCIAVLNNAGNKFLQDNSRRSLINRLRKYLMSYFDLIIIPKQYRFVQSLPTNSQGKTILTECKELFSKQIMEPYLTDLKEDDLYLHITLEIPQDLFYFKGHFTDSPIVPGVVQIDWAIMFARRYMKLSDLFEKMENIKFKAVIKPRTIITLKLNKSVDRSKVQFEFSSDYGIHSSGRIYFKN